MKASRNVDDEVTYLFPPHTSIFELNKYDTTIDSVQVVITVCAEFLKWNLPLDDLYFEESK